MPSPPFRLRVLQALTAALETSSIANGASANLAGSVYRGRAFFGEETPMPFISILESPTPMDGIDSSSSGESVTEWDLLIQGFVVDDPVHPTDNAYYLLADVKKILAQERKKRSGPRMASSGTILDMGGKVEDILIGSGVVRPADDISATSYFWLRITLKLVEDNYAPFG